MLNGGNLMTLIFYAIQVSGAWQHPRLLGAMTRKSFAPALHKLCNNSRMLLDYTRLRKSREARNCHGEEKSCMLDSRDNRTLRSHMW